MTCTHFHRLSSRFLSLIFHSFLFVFLQEIEQSQWVNSIHTPLPVWRDSSFFTAFDTSRHGQVLFEFLFLFILRRKVFFHSFHALCVWYRWLYVPATSCWRMSFRLRESEILTHFLQNLMRYLVFVCLNACQWVKERLQREQKGGQIGNNRDRKADPLHITVIFTTAVRTLRTALPAL